MKKLWDWIFPWTKWELISSDVAHRIYPERYDEVDDFLIPGRNMYCVEDQYRRHNTRTGLFEHKTVVREEISKSEYLKRRT